ncbi:Zinc finger DNA binding protein [Operophtera brumata]|uniref:Zinc finger DNA binding protein n=2 Tax=Operophtera brumata TaxID=104452 RepID=A0A0L7KMU7_OPEBR|nr:Zinc finger DNA binding protein [Operophtera brumata]KOB64435.1 Zinc finger DNA binding protein [Operophtera brumata]
MVKCGACGKYLKGGVVCPKCKSHSHNECVMVPVGAQVDDSWRCAECQNKVPKGRNPSTPRTVAQLKIELNERDQEALQSDLEIGHLPEEKGESVLHAVTVLAAKLGVTLEARDVVYAERVGVTQGAGAEGEVRRERRVVVRLARRHLRDQLLQAARVRRTLTASDAGCATAAVAGPRIFLNERLTRANRQLFHRVREECRKLQWRFSWTKRGRIYARQADGKQAYPIRSEADLLRVFGSGSV